MSTQNPQYMVKKLVPQWRFWKQVSPEKYGSGPVGLLKNLWGEVSLELSFLTIFHPDRIKLSKK